MDARYWLLLIVFLIVFIGVPAIYSRNPDRRLAAREILELLLRVGPGRIGVDGSAPCRHCYTSAAPTRPASIESPSPGE